MLTVMATKDSAPAVPSRSTTTPIGEESVTLSELNYEQKMQEEEKSIQAEHPN